MDIAPGHQVGPGDVTSGVAARGHRRGTDWGMPAGKTFSMNWVDYPMRPWRDRSIVADFESGDGRRRVASGLPSAIGTRGKTLIAIHDLDIRPQYRPALALLEEVERVDGLGVYRFPAKHGPGRTVQKLHLSCRTAYN